MLAPAIVFISVALCLYTLSIWSERIKKHLLPWMVVIFIAAFSCDLIGTSLMFFQTENKFQFSIHAVCGYSALLIMGLHLLWALAAKKHKGLYEIYFHRFSIVAWFIWLAAFFSGIPQS